MQFSTGTPTANRLPAREAEDLDRLKDYMEEFFGGGSLRGPARAISGRGKKGHFRQLKKDLLLRCERGPPQGVYLSWRPAWDRAYHCSEPKIKRGRNHAGEAYFPKGLASGRKKRENGEEFYEPGFDLLVGGEVQLSVEP